MAINLTHVQKLRAYALKNYATGGWDRLVECWTDAELLEHAGSEKWGTYRAMLAGYREMFGLINEAEQENNAGRLNGYNPDPSQIWLSPMTGRNWIW